MPVVPFRGPAPQPGPQVPEQPKVDDTFLMMAASQMQQEGRFQQATNIVRDNRGDNQNTSIRSLKSLQKALDNAEGDEDLLRIKKLMIKRGIDTDAIPQLNGVGEDNS